ncbi:MAG: hypothetical protein L3J07_01970 [Candidatus Magasanikbacteria bacterium]|nr:hypothetical protein [Candidatus Magasanikbacteria bacterium]
MIQNNIEYILPEDLINIINIIRGFEYEHKEEVPDYDSQRDSIDEYFALIDRSKTIYYPNITDKASFLFININTHYFSNGNKRLSVVSTVYFLEKNNYLPSVLSKENYKSILKSLFGDCSFYNWKGFEPKDFGLYNLAIIVAMKNESKKISDDELKEKVKFFFEQTFFRNN